MKPTMNRRPILGALDLFVCVVLLVAIWLALPARWWPVDVGGTVVASAFFVSGVSLVVGFPWARRFALVVAGITFLLGSSLVAALAFTLAYLAGLYGPVGQGGALILFFVALLLTPYLVFLPLAQLYSLSRTPDP